MWYNQIQQLIYIKLIPPRREGKLLENCTAASGNINETAALEGDNAQIPYIKTRHFRVS